MRSWMVSLASITLAVTALGAPIRASAQGVIEPWFFTGDVGVAGPINDSADTLFGLGGDASFGIYRPVIPELSFGSRVGVGILSEGEPLTVPATTSDLREPIDRPTPAPTLPVPVRPDLPPEPVPELPLDPVVPGQGQRQITAGLLDYEYLTLNMRVRPLARVLPGGDDRSATGLYVDLGAGAGLLDGDFAPFFNGAVGWNFGLGPVAIGPKFRFTHAVEINGRFGDDDVLTWMGGVEIAFLDQGAPEPTVTDLDVPPAAEVESPEQRAEIEDADGDWIADANDQCPEQREVFNGAEDADGCPDEGVGEFEGGELVVDERVFFDFDGSELRETGTAQLDAVVEHYREHGDNYRRLIIGGHADSRGPMDYNEGLSRERAEAVVDYLVAQGVPREIIEVEAYGERRPAIPDAQTEFEYQVNRRVAFRVDWEGETPVAEIDADQLSPTMPQIVDEAPQSVQEREQRADVQEREARERAIAEAELEEAGEDERVAIELEREATARLESARAEALVEAEARAPQARLQVQEEQAIE